MVTIPSRATIEGTKRFAARFHNVALGHFRCAQGWTVSSLGLGTFPGEDDDATDSRYAAAIAQAFDLGCNVIDTAVAYRNQRSERVIGQTVSRLIAKKKIQRDEVVIMSKAGFIPFDSLYPGSLQQYVVETFINPGVATTADIVAPGHCLAPKFLQHQIEASRRNLCCETIDIYFLHNPEIQLQAVDQKTFYSRIKEAFAVLEDAVVDGKISMYGVSSWRGFRVKPDAKDYLVLGKLVHCASAVGGRDHHFRALLLPINVVMLEGFKLENQWSERMQKFASVLQVAQDFGLTVVAGSSLHLGRLARSCPRPLQTVLSDRLTTDAQRALQFTRSVPGVTTALVGMSIPIHVLENLALTKVPPLSEAQFRDLLPYVGGGGNDDSNEEKD